MKNNYRKIILFILIYCAASKAQNIRFPTFHTPDEAFIRSQLLDDKNCPPNQARIKINYSTLNIAQHFCDTFCPRVWYWVIHSDYQCHDIENYNLKAVTINYELTPYESVDRSKITAYYGENKQYFLKFTMTTNPGEHWNCSKIPLSHTKIFCSNDIY